MQDADKPRKSTSSDAASGCRHSHRVEPEKEHAGKEKEHIIKTADNVSLEISALNVDPSKVKNLHELSCDMLSLSFLADEEEIYTLNDLRDIY